MYFWFFLHSFSFFINNYRSHPVEGVAESINSTMYSTYLKQQDQLIRDTNCKNSADTAACMQNVGQVRSSLNEMENFYY